MGELLGVLYKLSFKIFIWLIAVVKCLYCQDCQLPVKPVYGGLIVDGNRTTYYCYKGYGIMGASIIYCNEGRWQNSPPTCVKTATPLGNGERLNISTDNNLETCFDFKFHSKFDSDDDRLVFSLNRNYSNVIVRIFMYAPFRKSEVTIKINDGACATPKLITSPENTFAFYDFSCTLDTESNIVEVEISRFYAYTICEMEVLPNQISDIACPLSELSEVNGSITYEPEVLGENAPYGTAAVYRCNENTTLRGSEVRYCIEENQWSGNQTFCGRGEVSTAVNISVIPTENSASAVSLIITGVVVGLLLIFSLVAVVLCLRRKAKIKKNNKMSVKDACQQEEAAEHVNMNDIPCSIQTEAKNQLSQES